MAFYYAVKGVKKVTVFQSFLDVFKKNSELGRLYDLELIEEKSHRAYLKRMALDVVLNYVGRAISQSEFRVYKNGELNKTDWYYKLNIRPNKNMSASDFWHQFIYKLINDNEALIVLNDDNDLLLADDFEKTEYAVYEDRFNKVMVKDYIFKKSFPMNRVIYLQYNNDKMDRFTDGLFADYGELFGRMIDFSLRNNQIRSTVDIDTVANTSDKTNEKLQKFINKLYKQFSESSIAIVPQTKGFEYSEIASSTGNQSYGDISSLKNEFITDVAKAVGVPPALVHGEMADLSENKKAFIEFCIQPLLKQMEKELNAKLFKPRDYLSGSYIDVVGIDKPNVFELATAIDKLIGSGTFSRNEIREKLGEEPIDNDSLDEFVLTKNYETTEQNNLKGGEAE